MIKSINAVILKTNRLEATVSFYRHLGITLTEEKHGDGPIHFTCKIQGAHFGVYEHGPWTKEERRAIGQETMIGFEVESISEALSNFTKEELRVMIEPEEVEWGKRCVLLDPDGRPVELNESK